MEDDKRLVSFATNDFPPYFRVILGLDCAFKDILV